MAGGIGQISNNSILHANSMGRISQLLCLSGSKEANVGLWIAPDGTDITTTSDDPFNVTIGGSYNPGSVNIQTPSTNPSLSSADEGVYTCSIPDESRNVNYLHIGIYLSGFTSKYKT